MLTPKCLQFDSVTIISLTLLLAIHLHVRCTHATFTLHTTPIALRVLPTILCVYTLCSTAQSPKVTHISLIGHVK